MPQVLSINTGGRTPSRHTDVDVTGIDKRPVAGTVEVRAPGPKGTGGSGLVGDEVCDRRHHGGDDQAVYVYSREDLDMWQRSLGRELANGVFGENLTTVGLDPSEALVGERWRVGDGPLLEVAVPRIPCRTFAGWLGERGWVRRFTSAAHPGAYLRVLEPGSVRPGDGVTIVDRPEHEVSIGVTFRALTTEPELLSRLLVADRLPADVLRQARRRTSLALDEQG